MRWKSPLACLGQRPRANAPFRVRTCVGVNKKSRTRGSLLSIRTYEACRSRFERCKGGSSCRRSLCAANIICLWTRVRRSVGCVHERRASLDRRKAYPTVATDCSRGQGIAHQGGSPVIAEAGLTRVEIGTDASEHAFMNVAIFESLHLASMAIVDVTGERPNCFIELGYGLGTQNRVLVTLAENALCKNVSAISRSPQAPALKSQHCAIVPIVGTTATRTRSGHRANRLCKVRRFTESNRRDPPDLKSLEFEQRPVGPFGLGFSLKVKAGRPHPIKHYREKQLETEVICDNCTLGYVIYGLFGWCPDCGVLIRCRF